MKVLPNPITRGDMSSKEEYVGKELIMKNYFYLVDIEDNFCNLNMKMNLINDKLIVLSYKDNGLG